MRPRTRPAQDCKAWRLARSVSGLQPAFDLVTKMFLQEQLDQRGPLVVDLDDFGADTIIVGVYNLYHAFERFVGKKIAFEM